MRSQHALRIADVQIAVFKQRGILKVIRMLAPEIELRRTVMRREEMNQCAASRPDPERQRSQQ